jgi:hypothetical protein
MPQFILIHLHPTAPTTGDDFTAYLSGLTITARDISFSNPEGVLVGQISDPPEPGQIVQHIGLVPFPPGLQPAATAILQVVPPAGHPEHATIDVLLEVRRNGALLERTVHYNVPVIETVPPITEIDDEADNVAAYVALPAPGGLQADAPYVFLPADGTPPNFDELRAAVEAVLANDPGAGSQPDLSTLTPAQCDHIAREILANRSRRPLPQPPRTISELYLPSDSETLSGERDRFEAELLAYHGVLEAEAARLARYIFALSAALYNEDRTREAEQVRLRFPVRPGAEDGEGRIAQAEVVLTS